jgi:hypothetical protein
MRIMSEMREKDWTTGQAAAAETSEFLLNFIVLFIITLPFNYKKIRPFLRLAQ